MRQSTPVKIGRAATYSDPIKFEKGEIVQVTEKHDLWNDTYTWIWCINQQGKEGWVPESILEIDANVGIGLQDYDAIELDIAAGEQLFILEKVNGWYWCQNLSGKKGWVPVEYL